MIVEKRILRYLDSKNQNFNLFLFKIPKTYYKNLNNLKSIFTKS
jgi:hypothetical protein